MSATQATPRWRAILFDLDGTLVDSAPDLGGTGNDLRTRRGLPALPLDHFRPHTGTGARGLLAAALGVTPDHADFEVLRAEFLDHYQQRMTRDSVVFDGVLGVLSTLESAALPWGIVTNKATRFAEPLTQAFGLRARAATLVCGDTTARSKPHPEPLLEAARQLCLDPRHCLYVGDDHRDIVAGQAANMATAAAAWGYLGVGEPLENWGADHILYRPEDLIALTGLA